MDFQESKMIDTFSFLVSAWSGGMIALLVTVLIVKIAVQASV